jgi:signal transduction histidine kinase
LRRVSAELNDGPVLEMDAALLRLDLAISENEVCRHINLKSKCDENLPIVKTAVQTALQEMRTIATGLGLPQLEGLTLPEIISKVVNSHEQFTGTKVSLHMEDLPDQATQPVKITAYRLIQEALNNAHHHAGGVGQQVRVTCESNQIQIEVSDQGSGFDTTHPVKWTERLGVAGMRERVESMGGQFTIESKINKGTKVTAQLFLQNLSEHVNG